MLYLQPCCILMNNSFYNKIGLGASFACVIHCITFPLLIALIPVFNISFHINHLVEFSLIFTMVLLGGYSLYKAHKAGHAIKTPLYSFIVGVLLLLFFHLFAHSHKNVLLILGQVFSGLLIAFSQWKLYNLNRSSGCAA